MTDFAQGSRRDRADIAPVVRDTAFSALADAVAEVAAGAAARDADPSGRFPREAVDALARAGALRVPDGGYASELSSLRAVAGADLGVARILDGHLNAIERLRVQAPGELAERELAAIDAGTLRAGVWGADPLPAAGEGEPATTDGATIRGAKTFCSGASGLDRALVLARRDDAPVAAWVDLTAPGTVIVDTGWFRGGGMRASASHRVVFEDAPVLALFGPLTAQPWFARDAVRTAATWAGAADAAVDDALAHLAARPQPSQLEALAAGRLLTARATIDLWLDEGARVLGDPDVADADAARVSTQLRAALSDAIRTILDEASRATGSRPAATGTPLDRATRDLGVFLLQHRLDPLVARLGAAALEDRG